MAVRGQVPRLAQVLAQAPTPPQSKPETFRSGMASARRQEDYRSASRDPKAGGAAGNRIDSVLGAASRYWEEEDDIIAGDWAGMRRGVDARGLEADLRRRSVLHGLGGMDFEMEKMGSCVAARPEGASVLELLNGERTEDMEVEGTMRSAWGGVAGGLLGMGSEDEIFFRGESAQDSRLRELRSLTIKSLRALCRQNGLILKGTKEELVSRISVYEQSTGQAYTLKPGSTAADLFNCLSWDLPAEVPL